MCPQLIWQNTDIDLFYNLSMKLAVFLLTFLSYASVHMLRMTYSFNKHRIKDQFGVGELFLGILDSTIFISLAIGTFFRYSIINDKRLPLVCLKTAIPTAIAYSLVPIVGFLNGDMQDSKPSFGIYLFLLVSLGSFGFFQFTSFPLSLTILSSHFNVKTEGSLVGIWSSKSNAGNIIGFFMANFMVYQLHTRWQTPMFLCAIFHVIIAYLLFHYVEHIEDDQQPITTEEFFNFIKEKWSNMEFKLYILSFSFFKAILYSYEFWTPAFLVQEGFAKYSGYVPMVFDISTLFGSYLMGKLYQEGDPRKQLIKGPQPSSLVDLLKSYKFFVSSVLISVISVFYILVPSNILIYYLLGVGMGFLLGAVYNSLENSEILAYTNNNPRITDMFATANIGIGCILVGIFQLVIGFSIQLGHSKQPLDQKDQQHNYGVVYVIIAIFGVIATILTFLRSHYFTHPQHLSQKQIQLTQMSQKLIQN